MTYEENAYERNGRKDGIAKEFPVFDLKNKLYRENYKMIMEWLESRGEVPDVATFFMYSIWGKGKDGNHRQGWAILTPEQRISREAYEKMGFDTTQKMYHQTLFVIDKLDRVALPSDNIRTYEVWLKD